MDFDYFVGYILGLGSILLTGQPLIRGLTYEANKIAPNAILDMSTAMEAYRRGEFSADQLVAELSSQGLNPARIAIMQLLTQQLLASGDCIVGLYRGTITQDDFTKQMTRLGFSTASISTMVSNFETRLQSGDLFEAEHRKISVPSSIGDTEKELYASGLTADRVAFLRQLSLKVPQLQDLFLFASWNVEDPQAVADGGLADGKPDDYYDRAFAAGYDKPTADLYWASHWTPPPVFILHTLFQTGQLSEADLSYFLKVAQHPPGFIPKIVNAFYKQVSESQIVELLQNGTITESQVDALLKNNGYSPTAITLIHSIVMAKASMPSAEEKAALAQQKAQFKSLSVGNITSAYEEGIIDADEATAYMKNLGITDDIAAFQLKHSDWKMQKAQLNDNITAIGDSFMLGDITQADATAQLSQLGVSPVKQTNLIYKWLKVVPVKTKLPSEAQLTTFLKNQIIDIPTYQLRMRQLGYSDPDITLYIATINKSSVAAAELLIAQSQTQQPLP